MLATNVVLVNPYRALDIYTPDFVKSYTHSEKSKLQPHLFAGKYKIAQLQQTCFFSSGKCFLYFYARAGRESEPAN